MVLGAGLAFVAFLGAWHLGGILLIKKMKPQIGNYRYFAVLFAFWGVALLHFSEIVLGSLLLYFMLELPGVGKLAEGYETATDILYLAGMSYTTLGFSSETADGPVRLLIMLQALGGFMLITWSATFVYSIWNTRFIEDEEGG
ncbi:ion channel [Croceicoccus sp. F390]|uniref:Ion channel n=1 Tax=Croceicoccus esteveae TaxID=3075597 RepID=A0ABU2ZEF7_9SPHN|nr:ion channel [Croceicoccus sp. F390]MDT0574990.1 ion channel [Croceicoccus sp. F390]